jgi:hypothetical protein
LICDNEEYEAGHNKDLTKWKVSWEPKQAGGGKAIKGVSKKIHPSKPKVAKKSIAERLNININIKPVEKTGYDDDESVDLDDNDDRENDTEDEDEVTHERQRNESRGKAGLNGKGCLIDMSMFGGL